MRCIDGTIHRQVPARTAGSDVHCACGSVLQTLFSLFGVRSEEAVAAALTGGNGRVKFKRIATLNDAAALVRDGRV